jgi:hypothetical protein
MTQIRPRLDEDLAAKVQEWADRYSEKVGVPVSFNAATAILIRRGLTIKGDGNDENST